MRSEVIKTDENIRPRKVEFIITFTEVEREMKKFLCQQEITHELMNDIAERIGYNLSEDPSNVIWEAIFDLSREIKRNGGGKNDRQNYDCV
ncbi:TPA_asm: hypothetical protein vir520_00011 [Caudoviricetes sp. vir520]|nr:TPA_asm: hypothetical protein vir520_00011 [Caudoviricetes sp. vir520]